MSPRRIPTKAELLRLQKLYRTDRRIAEALGGDVTEHLVAYWRRKKGVARYSFPKFSEKEILEVWDRFGDDFHAGMELGISKAAFYNWRRRYKITHKPDALKLEQLSLELFTNDKTSRKRIGTGHQPMIQKILSRKVGVKSIEPGAEVEVEPDIALAFRNIGQVLAQFKNNDITYVWNPGRIILPLDGAIGQNGQEKSDMLKNLRDFARIQQIKGFFDIGEGDILQVAIEQGLVLPGQFVIGSDMFSPACGCLGAVTMVVSPQEMARIWAGGKARLTVPPTIRVNITGRSPRGVFARDIAHTILAQISNKEVDGKMIEFYGAAVDQMSIAERFTLCCLTMLSGVAGTICPFDSTTRRFINPRARRPFTPILADRNAVYEAEYTYDVNTMKPVIAGFEQPDSITPVDEVDGIPIQLVFLGGAGNGRFSDLKIAADVFKGKKVNPDTRVYIQPASKAVYLEALKKGLIRVFIEAGAVIVAPGNIRQDDYFMHPASGEKGLTTGHDCRLFSGQGELYQSSPATAAASAITGLITNPSGYLKI